MSDGTPWLDGLADLGTLGGASSTARAIHSDGFIVGDVDPAGNPDAHPFVWDPNTQQMHDLGTLGGDRGIAYDINVNGEIVGAARDGKDDDRPFDLDYGATPTSPLNPSDGDPGGAGPEPATLALLALGGAALLRRRR